MIAKLNGTVDSVLADGAVIDVGGVGYLVFASRRTLERLPSPSSSVALHVETHVREDHIHLYGFLEPAERDWFRVLLTVQGVGARVALAILGAAAPEQLTLAVAAQDRAVLLRADGVGPKLAGRVLAELRDKVDAISLGPRGPAEAPPPPGTDAATADAVSALVNLGYGRAEAFGAVAAVARRLGAETTVERLIPAALKELVP